MLQQQVDQGLVDDRVGPVTVLVEQPTEGVLHCPGRRREHVGLDRRQMDDVLADESLRDQKPFRVDVV